MNKYLILIIALIALIAAGVGYRVFLLPASSRPVNTGIVREVTIVIQKNSWSFDPEVIDAVRGDTLKLKFINEDDYDHGVGIDSYGVSQRIPARSTLDVPPFVVTKSGDFQFYCSVSCGEGIAEGGIHKGTKRSHFDQIGTICVHDKLGDRVCLNSNAAPIPGQGTTSVPQSTPAASTN